MEWDGALNGAWDGAYRGLGWGLSELGMRVLLGIGMGVLLGFLYMNKFDFVG